jgi:hypothetical protein
MPGFGGMGGSMGGGKGKEQKPSPSWSDLQEQFAPKAMHSGGTVKKTGNYRLRKGEKVLTIAQQKSVGIKKTGKLKSSPRKISGKKGF